MPDEHPPTSRRSSRPHFLIALLAMAALLAVLFYDSFRPGWVLFSNDSPAAHQFSRDAYRFEDLRGAWHPLHWVGREEVSNRLTFSWLMGIPLGAAGSAKFYAPLALLFLGASAWFFCRQLRFHPAVCALAGGAAMLNMNAFSNACWGLSAWIMARGMIYLALAALISPGIRRTWLRYSLAGFAVGMSVMEGFDMGAIFSVYVAFAAIAIHGIVKTEDPPRVRLAKGVGWTALMTVCALLIAGQCVITLVETQVQGVQGAAQDDATRRARWDFATRWSLPKREIIRVAIPGAFGYRMDTPDGGRYWGMVGRSLPMQEYLNQFADLNEVEQARAREVIKANAGALRHSGSGEYAGVLVLLLAAWALIQSCRAAGPFDQVPRRLIWLFGAGALFSLLMAFGRYAPLYGLAYELPWFSAIRNPIKFMQAFHTAVVILFAFGLQDLAQRFLQPDQPAAEAPQPTLREWWSQAGAFEQKWIQGCLGFAGLCALGFIAFANSKEILVERLTLEAFQPLQAAATLDFSIREWAVFLVFLAATLCIQILILVGRFRGARAGIAWGLLAFVLIADFARANAPWIRYLNYEKEYAANDILDILKRDAHERRVAIAPFPEIPYLQSFRQDYIRRWLNESFRYHGIQSLDIPQEPRMKEEKARFKEAIGDFTAREYELTGTRFLIGVKSVIQTNGPVDFIEVLNDRLDPEQRRFRMHTPFSIDYDDEFYPRATPNDSGPLALIEFTGALPRARLFHQWESAPDPTAALQRIVDPEFDPTKSVTIVGNAPPSGRGVTLPRPEPVKIVHYDAHRVVLEAIVGHPAILLLNDGHHEDWKVRVNGEPAELLRANYLMRGVYLEPGAHDIEFRFQPVSRSLYLSGATTILAFGLTGLAVLDARRRRIAPVGADRQAEGNPSTS